MKRQRQKTATKVSDARLAGARGRVRPSAAPARRSLLAAARAAPAPRGPCRRQGGPATCREGPGWGRPRTLPKAAGQQVPSAPAVQWTLLQSDVGTEVTFTLRSPQIWGQPSSLAQLSCTEFFFSVLSLYYPPNC